MQYPEGVRFFNTAGPVQPEIHYHVPPLARLDADDLLPLMRQRKYFVLHAPRQTGKTSALLTLGEALNAAGDFRCVYVNGGGRIEREYGLGRRRTDLLIVWPVAERAGESPGGAGGNAQKVVVECKLLHGGAERTLRDGLAQTRAYMDRCRAVEGHLVLFDRDPDRAWDEKLYRRETTEGGVPVTIWGM